MSYNIWVNSTYDQEVQDLSFEGLVLYLLQAMSLVLVIWGDRE